MSQEQFAENDLEMADGATEHCVDSRNETLIKHFDRNFNRSKSNVDFNNQSVVVTNNQERNGSNSPVFDRGIADGGSNQPDSDFGEYIDSVLVWIWNEIRMFLSDEFSSQDEDDELSKKQTIPRMLSTQQPIVISRCKALYNYSPKLYDELELNPGRYFYASTGVDILTFFSL